MKSIDHDNDTLEKIRTLYTEDKVAKAAFDYFAACQRNKRTTTVHRLLHVLQLRGTQATYGEVKHFLREIANLGCGKYVIGRRKHPSRIEWAVGLVSLGQAAAGNRIQVEQFVEEGADQEETDEIAPGASQLADMKVQYPLRPDRNVELMLPKDLTTREAHRLAEFIKTLPFEGVSVAA